jgi:hypothetical protein
MADTVEKLKEGDHPEPFEGLHKLAYLLPDGRAHLILSGVALLDLQGAKKPSGQEHYQWVRRTYELTLRTGFLADQVQLPPVPEGQRRVLRLERWAVFAGLNSIDNLNLSNDAGHAVDRFGLRAQSGTDINDDVTMFVDLAVRDEDGHVRRVGYQLNLIAKPDTVPV